MFYIGKSSVSIGDKIYNFGDVVKGISKDTEKNLISKKLLSSKKPKENNLRLNSFKKTESENLIAEIELLKESLMKEQVKSENLIAEIELLKEEAVKNEIKE